MRCTRCGEEASFVEEHDDWWCAKCERYVLPAPGASKSKPPAVEGQFLNADTDALREFLSLSKAGHRRFKAIADAVVLFVAAVVGAFVSIAALARLDDARMVTREVAARSEFGALLKSATDDIGFAHSVHSYVFAAGFALALLAGLASILSARRLARQCRVAEILRSERGVRFLEVGRRRNREP